MGSGRNSKQELETSVVRWDHVAIPKAPLLQSQRHVPPARKLDLNQAKTTSARLSSLGVLPTRHPPRLCQYPPLHCAAPPSKHRPHLSPSSHTPLSWPRPRSPPPRMSRLDPAFARVGFTACAPRQRHVERLRPRPRGAPAQSELSDSGHGAGGYS